MLKKISAYFGVFILIFSSQTFFSNADDFATNFDKNGEYVEGQVLMKLDDSRVDVDSFAGRTILNTMEVTNDVDTQDVFREQNLVLMRDIGKNGLLFCFRFGLGKLINVIYLFIFGSMFKKKLVDAVRQT